MNRSWEGIKSVFNEIIYYPVMIWLKKIWHLKNRWSQSSNYLNNDANCLTLLPDQSVAVKRLWCTSGSHLFLCILIYNSWLQISWLFSKLSRGCKHAFDLSALLLLYYIQYLDIFQMMLFFNWLLSKYLISFLYRVKSWPWWKAWSKSWKKKLEN